MEQKDSDALWYKDAIIYQLHVRAFYDSNGDGIGDFRGLTQKLDYLADLGVTAIWILPFYPSPLRDDGYDIADYESVHPDYGDMEDFESFLQEAHKRGLKVITELVVNHTSDQHAWFQKSRRAEEGSYWRDFYVWTDDPKKYKEARIIFKDFESSNWSWDPVAKQYYWHRFYSHQPDLNYDNENVGNEVLRVMESWLEKGVDGLRLDAVPYLFEREGTSCENLPETHVYLKKLRAAIDEKFPNRMLLAEANQWPEDAISYFGDGDECHMCFHFPLMPRLFMALKMEDRFSIIDILRQTPEIPDNCQWATFLRNHDELTLEMVTDEERDYMYNMYAADPRARINLGIRRRLAPLLENDRRQIELLNALLFSLPGTPIVYYGDELGMGDNIYLGDRHGVRTPFQWSPDRNAGFSKANPQSLYLPVIMSPEYNYETINVETQNANPHSLLWWMKNIIAIRKKYAALKHGEIEFLEPTNGKVLCFIRRTEGEDVLVVANLSRKAQCVEIDLRKYDQYVPVELFGKTEFPPIGELPYFITLGPYGYYWFELHKPESETEQSDKNQLQTLRLSKGDIRELSEGKRREQLESMLPGYLVKARWFSSKARKISECSIEDLIPLSSDDSATKLKALFFVKVLFTEGEPERYLVPLCLFKGGECENLLRNHIDLCIASIQKDNQSAEDGSSCVLADAFLSMGFSHELLRVILEKQNLRGERFKLKGEIFGPVPEFEDGEIPEAKFRGFDQSNSSVVFGKSLILKMFRKLHPGENPDIEVGRFFLKYGYEGSAPLVGALTGEISGKTYSLGMVQCFVPNEGDAWTTTVTHLSQFAELSLTRDFPEEFNEFVHLSPFDLIGQEVPTEIADMIGVFLPLASQLGQRTAEMHLALATSEEEGGFGYEEFTPFYQRSLYQSLRNTAGRTRKEMLLKREHSEALKSLSESEIRDLLEKTLSRLSFAKDRVLSARRIRTHGDFHLGQVLYTGKDFVIIDFEGEPGRSVSERKLRRSPLRDVAGMLRSFDYAVYYVMRETMREIDHDRLRPWLRVWSRWTLKAYLEAYLDGVKEANIVPNDIKDIRGLTEVYLIEKALYEINYELNNRPDWVDIPLEGIQELCLEKK